MLGVSLPQKKDTSTDPSLMNTCIVLSTKPSSLTSLWDGRGLLTYCFPV